MTVLSRLFLLVLTGLVVIEQPGLAEPQKPAAEQEADPFAPPGNADPFGTGPFGAVAAPSAMIFRSGDVTPEKPSRIERALLKPIDVDFVDTEMSDAVDFLQEASGVSIAIEIVSLEDHGIGTDTPITLKLTGLTLRSVLNHVVRAYGLVWTESDDQLVILAEGRLSDFVSTATYPVGSLVRHEPQWHDKRLSDSIDEMIKKVVEPGSWVDVGGPCAGEVFEQSAVISCDTSKHWVIRDLIRTLAKAADSSLANPGKSPPSCSIKIDHLPGDARVTKMLAKRISCKFVETGLRDVLDHLSAIAGVPISADKLDLDRSGIGTDTPLSFRSDELTIDQVLTGILHRLDLTWQIRDEAVVVRETIQPNVRVFPVADLTGTDADRIRRLSTVLRETIDPRSWSEERGALANLPGIPVLVVSQTEPNFLRLENVLRGMRAARRIKTATQEEWDRVLPVRQPAQDDAYRLLLYERHWPERGLTSVIPVVGADADEKRKRRDSKKQSRRKEQRNERRQGKSTAPRPSWSDVREIVESAVEPDSWNEGGGRVWVVGHGLLIHQRTSVHVEIRRVLWQIGWGNVTARPAPRTRPDLSMPAAPQASGGMGYGGFF